MANPFRGIDSFMGQFAGTVPRGRTLDIRRHELPPGGWEVLAAGQVLGVVLLVREAGDTADRLRERLPELYPPEPVSPSLG